MRLADSALSCYQELKDARTAARKESCAQFKAQPLAKRLGSHALDALAYGGAAIAAASLAGKGIGDKMEAKKVLTPAENNKFGRAIIQAQRLYVHCLLLESIQYLAQKKLDLQNTEALAKADLKPFSDELKAKITLLTAKLKEPSKELQDKVQKLAPNFKLADLDTVYEIAKSP